MAGNIEECLKKFIHHVDKLGHEDEPGGDGFWREFKELREIQQANKAENKFPAEEGKKECNIKKNRYKDILPYDLQRVVLKPVPGVEGSDYINASYILDTNGEKSYIASQGPLPHTVNDFWRMLWETKVEIVFMVCREEEQGRNKCQRYWAEEGETKTFGDIEVTLDSTEEIFPDFFERKICARCGDEIHQVRQFHYTGWPDHGIPKHSEEIYKMVGKMREERRQLHIPIVIHCSAGCGRTGTICAVDYAWTMLDQGKIAHGFSMFEIIKNIRQQRQSMVQTPDQYEFVHLVVQSLCTDWLEKFQEHDYANWELPTEGDDVYYNTIGLDNNSCDTDDLYQDIKEIPPLHGPKKPQPTPRPPGLELNNNEPQKVKAAKPATENYENVVVSKKRSAPSKPSSVENGNTKQGVPQKTVSGTSKPDGGNVKTSPYLPPKNVAPIGPSKPGQPTVISVGVALTSKQPPTHTPPSPSTLAHKNAVKNRSHEPLQVNLPSDGTVQQAAKSRVQKKASNEPQPTAPPQAEYGVVVKDLSSGKLNSASEAPTSRKEAGRLGSQSDASSSQKEVGRLGSQSELTTSKIEVGQKARESTDKVPSSSDADAPVLPSRNYYPEEASPVSKHPVGTVSAQGGVPSKTAFRPTAGLDAGIYAEIVPATVQQHTSTPQQSTVSTSRDRIKGGFETIANILGRGKQSSAPVKEDRQPGKHIFLSNDISFPHRVNKPKGPRPPKTKDNTWSTRL